MAGSRPSPATGSVHGWLGHRPGWPEALLALGVSGSVCLATYLGVLTLLRVSALTDVWASLRELRIGRSAGPA